jgi:hypothetical protein
MVKLKLSFLATSAVEKEQQRKLGVHFEQMESENNSHLESLGNKHNE